MDLSRGLSTPLPTNLRLPSLEKVQDAIVMNKYRSLTGKLLYISTCMRFEISYSVKLMARYCSNHSKTIWKYWKGIYVDTKNQVADICTKSLNKEKHHYLLERFPILYAYRSGDVFDSKKSQTEILKHPFY